MGKLSGYAYRDIIKRLKLFGFSFYRQAAGSHEIWYNKAIKKSFAWHTAVSGRRLQDYLRFKRKTNSSCESW
jgi:hypothetical protein